jgi:DNA-binding MarR family transcriptional regulator
MVMTKTPGNDLPEDLQALANALRPALFHIMRQLRRDSEDSGLGVSPLQNYLLAMIGKHPGIGVSELARMEKLRGPTISGHIKPLEAAGLLMRIAPENGDRRRSGLHLTDKGGELVDTLRTQRTDWLARRLAKLSPEARAALALAIDPLRELGQ